MKSADEIREHQRAMCQGMSLELDDKTKKLQQAYSKFNHKQRKAAREDDDSGGGHYMMAGPNGGHCAGARVHARNSPKPSSSMKSWEGGMCSCAA
jgi:hypothetical protein